LNSVEIEVLNRGVVLEEDFDVPCDVHEFRHLHRNKKMVAEGESFEERQGQASRKGLPGNVRLQCHFKVKLCEGGGSRVDPGKSPLGKWKTKKDLGMNLGYSEIEISLKGRGRLGSLFRVNEGEFSKLIFSNTV
jgi:hypothetical protein